MTSVRMSTRAVLALLGWLTLAGFATARASDGAPTAAVRETVDAVVATLRDPALDPDARRAATLALVERRFDFREMTRRTLATNWRLASEAQRERITAAFRARLTETYWRRLAGYAGQRVDYTGERLRGPRLATVRTMIRGDTTDIPVDYKLYLKDGGWHAYDVVIEQVSLVRNYRADFHETVRKRGLDGLIAVLEGG